MSFFSEANEDALSVAPDAAATGPRVGFLESWAVSYNEQVRASAMYGIENQMENLENEQRDTLRRAGIENIPSLMLDSNGALYPTDNDTIGGAYLDTARFYEDGGDPDMANRLSAYDKRIDELRKEFPNLNLRTSREMWDSVKSAAQAYEQRASNDRRTLAGSIGGFLGGAVGAMNPASDPFNFLTAPVGGAGRTVAGRIAGQTLAQGAIEGFNQLTGVQEQRRLLGLEFGVGDAVSRVAGAAVGGAALQGVGEAAAFGIRRWFRSTPTDIAEPPTPEVLNRPALPDTSAIPPQAIPADENLAAAKLTRAPETYIDYMHEQSPLSGTRAGRARTVFDLDYMTSRMDDWNEARPWEIAPKTDTAVTLPRGDFVNAPDMQRFVEKSQVDDIARTVDPDTFRKYDALAERKQTYKRWLDEFGESQNAELQARIDDLDNRIYQMAMKADETGGKRAAKLRKDIQALEAEKAAAVAESGTKETPDMARVRSQMMADDAKMRDLAPLVSRAYARARQKWTNTNADREALVSMMREGRTDIRLDEQAARVLEREPEVVPQTLADQAPILQAADTVAGKVAADADAADIAQAIVAENVKSFDEALERYRTSLDSIIGEEKNGEIQLDGHSYKLNLDKDKITVPNEDGSGTRELTVRQLLEENKMNEHELEAVSTCSLRKTL